MLSGYGQSGDSTLEIRIGARGALVYVDERAEEDPAVKGVAVVIWQRMPFHSDKRSQPNGRRARDIITNI